MEAYEVSVLVRRVVDTWPARPLPSPEAMTHAWVEALNPAMTLAFAQSHVDRLLRTPGAKRPEPGDFNKAWGENAARSGVKPCGGPLCDGYGWRNGRQANGNLIAEKCPDCPPVIRTPGMSPGLKDHPVACPPELMEQMRLLIGGQNKMGDMG